jgi:hypothetical protein
LAVGGQAIPIQYSPRGQMFLRALMASIAGLIIGLFFFAGPKALSGEPRAVKANVVSGSQGDAGPDLTQPVLPAGPFATRVLTLYGGPSEEDYSTLGTVARNSPLEVVGRSSDFRWVAVAVTPAAQLYGWIRVDEVANLPALATLPVKQPASLGSR